MKTLTNLKNYLLLQNPYITVMHTIRTYAKKPSVPDTETSPSSSESERMKRIKAFFGIKTYAKPKSLNIDQSKLKTKRDPVVESVFGSNSDSTFESVSESSGSKTLQEKENENFSKIMEMIEETPWMKSITNFIAVILGILVAALLSFLFLVCFSSQTINHIWYVQIPFLAFAENSFGLSFAFLNYPLMHFDTCIFTLLYKLIVNYQFLSIPYYLSSWLAELSMYHNCNELYSTNFIYITDEAKKAGYFSFAGWHARSCALAFQTFLSLHHIKLTELNMDLNRFNELLQQAEFEHLDEIISLRKEIVTKIFLMSLGIDTCYDLNVLKDIGVSSSQFEYLKQSLDEAIKKD